MSLDRPALLKSAFTTASLIGRRLGFAAISVVAAVVFFTAIEVSAAPEISTSDDDTLVTVGNAPEQEVYVFGRSVVIEQRAKGVLAVGGDVIVKGRVEGDVATIGGNVLQGHDAYVGGDVIVFGGSYKALDTSPQRESGKETVVFGVFEDELRSLAQDPLRAVSPVFTAAFFAQRIVLALIWFVIGLAVTTIAPGAVGRASARIQLSPLKVCAVGAAGFILISAGMIAGAVALPPYLSASVGALGFVIILLGYVFGRVALQITLGRWICRMAGISRPAESVVMLAGVAGWTFLLSLPVVWMAAVFAIFAFGIGSILSARRENRTAVEAVS
ncbi:MAG: hypothetical protein KF736_07975 [Acidobacteria bacterium]|nr:hypothetical protein [Acidobacteriota bacterium]MCW5948941.1 hypothetical protein [Pyrinomonadaceae bacterium]